MVRLPPGWRGAYHPPAGGRGGNALNWRPGYRGSGMRPIVATPVTAYTRRLSGIDLRDGDVQGTIAGGILTLSVGPQALGTVWYPAQVTLSTTTGPLDTSTALVWTGAQGVPTRLAGTVYTGNGTLGLAIPQMTPGQFIIVQWTGAHNGDIAAAHVIGTMDALTSG